MEIEMIEFFPSKAHQEKYSICGTVSYRIKPFGIIIRGHFVGKKKETKNWSSSFPAKKTIHSVTGQDCRYPLFTFEDKQVEELFNLEVKKKAIAFVQEWKREIGNKAHCVTTDEEITIGKSRSRPVVKVYVEPPKREFKPRHFFPRRDV